MRDMGFAAKITVKTAGASHAFVELVERHFDMLLARLPIFALPPSAPMYAVESE